MTDVSQATKITVEKKAVEKSKSDETLLKDAKQRIMRLQKKTKKTVKEGKKPARRGKKLEVLTNPKKKNRLGVVYLGHLPHGFYEEELKSFFSQFGKVQRVKVSRSRKTGKSKGYAFVEFAFNDVAKIVAETMNNYLMFERLVKAQYIPPEKVHSKMFPVKWITPNRYPTLVRRNAVKNKQEKPADEKGIEKHRSRIQYKLVRAVNILKNMGITYAPHVYDPEAAKDSTQTENSDVNMEEIPQLVAIQTSTTNSPSTKQLKATKKNTKTLAKAVAKPSTTSPSEAVTSKVITPASDSVESPNKKMKLSAKTSAKDVVKVSPTPPKSESATPKLKAKASVKPSTTPTISASKPLPKPSKALAKPSPKPSKVPAKPSPKPSKVPANQSPKPSKIPANQSPKPTPKPSSKPATKPSPKVPVQPLPKVDSKKLKPKSLVKEVSASPKMATRSVRGKKAGGV